VWSAQALVAWHGSFCSVPPGHADQAVTVRHKLGGVTVDVVTGSRTVLACHHRAPDHADASVRDPGHVTVLEARILTARLEPQPSLIRRRPRPARPGQRHQNDQRHCDDQLPASTTGGVPARAIKYTRPG